MRKINYLIRFVLFTLLFALPASAGAADPRVVTPDSATLDRNLNKISDFLEMDLGISPPGPSDFFITSVPSLPTQPDEPIEVLIDLSAPPEASDLEKILGQGGSVLGKWRDLVYALAVRLPRAEILNLIQENGRVVFVEGIPRSRSALFRAVKHIRAREVWKGGGGLATGYTGSGQVVAVLDTGIDDSHPDLAGRIKYWEDVKGTQTDTTPSTIYYSPDPFDKNGHGTHVSGIVAGGGEAAGGSTVPVSFPSLFPSDEGTGYVEPIPIHADLAQPLEARLWAEKPGGYYFTVYDENYSVSNTPLFDDSIIADGVDQKSVDLQDEGVYYAVFSTDDQDAFKSAGSFYIGQIIIPYDSYDDGFSLARGVAPGAGIAAFKILDDEGNGDAIAFVQALESISNRAEALGIVAVNASLTFDILSPTVDTTVENLVEGGIAFVTAAGNDRETNIGSPGTTPLSIAVGAMTIADKLTDYSSPGGNRKPMKPDVLAPGGGGQDLSYIFSADTNDSDSTEDANKNVKFDSDRFPDDYWGKIGTSQASAFVSGLVALLAEAKGTWNYGSPEAPIWAKQLILMTASEINQGEISAYVPALGRAVSPQDNREGYGRINPDAALEAATLTYQVGNPVQVSLDAKSGGKRAWARALELDRANEYTFTLQNPTRADFDLYLYESVPDENGEPVIAASCAREKYGDEKISGFRPEQSGKFYLAVKRVSGFGQFSLTSEAQVYKSPAFGCGILPVSRGDGEPEGLILLAGMALFLGPIFIIKLRARRQEQGAGSKGQRAESKEN